MGKFDQIDDSLALAAKEYVNSMLKIEYWPYKGRRVILNTGKYKHRYAVIDGVIFDDRYGVLFLCIVPMYGFEKEW